jgi:hypothetical protein
MVSQPRRMTPSIIHPIYKGKGKTESPGNYRRISLLVLLSKIIPEH